MVFTTIIRIPSYLGSSGVRDLAVNCTFVIGLLPGISCVLNWVLRLHLRIFTMFRINTHELYTSFELSW